MDKGTSGGRTNDALRLRSILHKAKDAKIGPEQNFYIAWGRVFDIQDAASEAAMTEIISGVNEVRELNERVLAKLEGINDLTLSLYSEPLLILRKILEDQRWTEAQWANINGVLTPVNFKILDFIVDIFLKHSEFEEELIPSDELKEIRQEIADLYQQVLESDLKKSLKKFLLEMLAKMQQGIHIYDVGGIQHLRKEFGEVFGRAITNAESLNEQKKNPLVVKFFDVVIKAGTLVDAASKGVKALAPFVRAYLTSGDGPPS